jgi:hypothetical protein
MACIYVVVYFALHPNENSNPCLSQNQEVHNTTLFQQYSVSFLCALVAFLLKLLYLDSPLIEEWDDLVVAAEGGEKRKRVKLPTSYDLFGFVLFAPMHAVVLTSVTCVAAAFKLLLDSDEAEHSVVALLMTSLGVTLISVGLCKIVKYDMPTLDAFAEVSRVDLRILAEFCCALVLVMLGFVKVFGRLSCVVCVCMLLLLLILFEYGYCKWTLKRIAKLREVEVMGSLDESLLTKE